MKTIKDEMLVIIPYVNDCQGSELETALYGWNTFCKSPFRLIVIGDWSPVIEGNAEFVEFKRTPEIKGQYRPNIDVARKLDYIYEKFHEEYDHFVLANDDEYAIRDFTYEYFLPLYKLQDSFMGNSGAPTNYWTHDMSKTRKALDSENKPHVNFANHNPFYFNMEGFHLLSVKFDLANNSMIRENLYYNYYEIPIVGNINTVRYGQWDHNLRSLYVAFKDENIKFVCNSNSGYTDAFINNVKKFQKRNVVEIQEKVTQKVAQKVAQENIEKSDTIIVSFTSWKKRIQNCAHTVDLMKNQTLKPNKIILNLSTDEFPKKEEELPKELVDRQDDVFEIFWVKENTKVYKKIIPTLERFPEDVIISIDDDIEYPKNSIESIYNKYLSTNRNNPITAGTWDWEDNIASHLGALTLFTKEMFGDYLNDLYENVVLKNGLDIIPFDDAIFTYSALLNNRKYIKSNNPNCLDLVRISPEHKKNRILHNLKDTYKNTLDNEHKILRDYIKEKYGKTYENLIKESTERFYYSSGKKYNNEKAIISLTSWKARINTVYKTIDSLLDKCPGFHIVLVLSIDEFPKKEKELPKNLMSFIDSNKIELLWVKKNYKAFKKVLFTIDKYRSVPVISADDDCIYLKNYAQEFYDVWEKNKDCFISCWVDIKDGIPHTGGAATLYPPFIFGGYAINILEKNKIYELTNQDDEFMYLLKKKFGLKKAIKIGNHREIYQFHDEEKPLRKEIKNNSFEKRIIKIKNYIL